MDPFILNFGVRMRWMVSLTPWPPCPLGKSPRYPLNRKLGGPENRSGCFREKSVTPAGNRTIFLGHQLLASSPYCLHYPGSYCSGHTAADIHNVGGMQSDHLRVDRRDWTSWPSRLMVSFRITGIEGALCCRRINYLKTKIRKTISWLVVYVILLP